jgi:hypothetical protein
MSSSDSQKDPFYTEVLTLGQKCLESSPVTILGSGASMSHDIRGMGPLSEHLIANVTTAPGDESIWHAFKDALSKTRDLERALQEVQLPDSLFKQVVHFTREMVTCDDCSLFDKLMDCQSLLPLSSLFSHLLRSTHPTISVVTTNYDRIAEYAANCAGHQFHDGFTAGYLRHFRPVVAELKDSRGTRLRRVNIWKVHGSIDWFVDQNGVPRSLPYREAYPSSHTPLLVTPGLSKYMMTHQEPYRTVMTQADAALAAANGFLCVGYGFADMHIEPKLVSRATEMRTPIVILARTLRQGAKTFLQKCKHDRFLALEKNGTGTRAYTSTHPDGRDITDVSLWELGTFLTALGIIS